MARVLSLEEIDSKFRSAITGALRVCDEAVVLPGATRSIESGSFKNVVVRLAGTEPDLAPDVFSSAWWSGVSLLPVPKQVAEAVLDDSARRKAALQKLAEQIPSEAADSELVVGPELDGDSNGCDKNQWTAGFDGPACCVGLYSCSQTTTSDPRIPGIERQQKNYYLVCKAGAGLAAQTFHSRLATALRSGKTLEEALERGEPGPLALRRVSEAGARNRARILRSAAQILGFHAVDTVSDHTASPTAPSRCAVVSANVNTNTLRRVDCPGRAVFEYCSGSVDAAHSAGLVSCSNLADGFVLFTTVSGDKPAVRNDAHDNIPFVTPRICSSREACARATKRHPDHAWVRDRFSWKNRAGCEDLETEPAAFWGSHATENFVSHWSRELGLQNLRATKLQPELVCCSALEGAKLRALARARG